MRLEILKRFAAVGLAAMAVLLALPATAFAHDWGDTSDRHMLGQPHFQATVSSGEDTTLAHTKKPTKMTVCADRHNQHHANIRYDEHNVNLGAGSCVLVDGSYVTGRSGGDSNVHLYGWHHHHSRFN